MMSNKYEHSWKRIESLDIWSIPFSTPSSNWGEYIKCGDDIEASYQISEDLEVIKELVDKETPMKPRYRPSGNIKCWCGLQMFEEQQDWYRYCAGCGQRIDWSDEE